MPPEKPERAPRASAGGDIYLEFTTVGQFVSVAAIDAGTGVEVRFAVPLSARRSDIERLARQKLRYRLAQGGPADENEAGRKKGRFI